MVGAGAGVAFSDVGVLLSDITVLGGDDEDIEKQAQSCDATVVASSSSVGPEVSPQKGDQDIGPPSEKKQGVKRKWVDLDKEINTARRGMRSTYDALRRQLCDVHSQMVHGVRDIEALPVSVRKLCSGEIAVAKVRLAALQHVLGHDQQELSSFLASFVGGGSGSNASVDATLGASAEAGSTDIAAAKIMTKAPPCQNYEQLALLSAMDAVIDNLDTCLDMDALRSAQNIFTLKLQPFGSLLSACKSAVAELKSAMKSAGKGGDVKKVHVGNISEVGPQLGSDILIVTEGDEQVKRLDHSVPFYHRGQHREAPRLHGQGRRQGPH